MTRFLWIFTTRLSDNRSLVGFFFALAATTRVTQLSSSKRKWHRKCWVRVWPANPRVSGLLIASLIPLMNSASQCLCPEWQHGTGHWVGSGDSEGVRCHLLCHCALHFPLLKLNRKEKSHNQRSCQGARTMVKTSSAFWSFTRTRQELGHLKTFSPNYSCHSHYTSFCAGSIWAVDI